MKALMPQHNNSMHVFKHLLGIFVKTLYLKKASGYLETMDGFSWAPFSNINERPKVIFCASDLSQRMFESRHKLSSWTFDNSMSCNWYLEQDTEFLLVLLSISTVCENLICQIPENFCESWTNCNQRCKQFQWIWFDLSRFLPNVTKTRTRAKW